MADSLVLTGVKQVTKHTGTEMTRIDAKRGGNTHMLKRWWSKGNGTVYVDCTLFRVEAGGNTGYLAIEAAGEGVDLRIDHDGAFGFSFYHMNECTRGALYDENMALVEHYVFPRISGGKTMVVTPPDAAAKPGGGGGGGGTPPAPTPDTTINSATVSGDSSPEENTASVYTVAVTGDATPYTYSWSASGGTVTSGGTTSSATITWGAAGVGSAACTVSSTNADFDGADVTDVFNVTVSAATPFSGGGGNSSGGGGY